MRMGKKVTTTGTADVKKYFEFGCAVPEMADDTLEKFVQNLKTTGKLSNLDVCTLLYNGYDLACRAKLSGTGKSIYDYLATLPPEQAGRLAIKPAELEVKFLEWKEVQKKETGLKKLTMEEAEKIDLSNRESIKAWKANFKVAEE